MLIRNTSKQVDVRGMSVIVISWQFDYSLPSGTYALANIPAGYRVHDGWNECAQAFDGTGTSAKLGDGDDDDGYQDNTDLALTVVSTVTTPAAKLFRNSGNPFANGKTYRVADTLDLVWVQGTTPTVGVEKGGVILINPSKDGVPPGATTLTMV